MTNLWFIFVNQNRPMLNLLNLKLVEICLSFYF
nr:MAG TPA: hypothetical protein [Caudoviricetes sp.]